MIGTRRNPPFTIFELLIILTLIAIAAALAIPLYFEHGDVTLENASLQLARDLRLAQNRAAYLGTPAVVVFDPGGDGYRVIEGADSPLRAARSSKDYVRRYSRDGVFEGVSITSARFGNGEQSMRYGPRGQALVDGTISLAFRGEQRIVHVERHTGIVTIENSSSGWHDDGR